MGELFASIQAIIMVIVLFGLVVMVHELGHFVFAKLFGIRVDSFNIGFGPEKWAIWKMKLGETVYSIRPFPLGGFVQLHGHFTPDEQIELGVEPKMPEAMGEGSTGAAKEEAREMTEAEKRSIIEAAYDDAHALRGKPFFVKLLVFGGGVLFNFLSVALALTVFYMVGKNEPVSPPILEQVSAQSALYETGFRSRDRIVAIDDKAFHDWYEMASHLESIRDDEAAPLAQVTVARHGGASTDTLAVTVTSPTLQALVEAGLWTEPRIGAMMPGRPAELAGLKKGDLFVEVAGQPVDSWSAMTAIIRDNPGQEIAIAIERDGETLRSTITPEAETSGEEQVGRIGIVPFHETRLVRIANPATALRVGFQIAITNLTMQVVQLGRLFGSGDVESMQKNLGGPVMILSMSYSMARQGFEDLFNFFVMLSLALVIFNILPIPLLDGGHIVQAGVESIIRRPIPIRVLNWAYNAALLFLLLFVLFFTFNDFYRETTRMGRKDLTEQQSQQPEPSGAGAPAPTPTP